VEISLKKAANRFKAAVEERQGPAVHDPRSQRRLGVVVRVGTDVRALGRVGADHRRIMPLVTFAHGDAEIDRLVRARRDLVDERGDPGAGTPVASLPRGPELRADQAMLPRDAFFAAAEKVRPEDAVGRVSAELVTPYPPGIPTVAPGEVYTGAIVSCLEEVVANGGFVEGAVDTSLGELRVVA
jgi:arginine decarboxylase